MIYDKPTGEVFASEANSGESAEFPDIQRGWGITKEQTASKPPMSWMNGAFKRVDENLEYLRQRGIAEWDEKLTYPAGAYVQHKGKSWKAMSENTGKEPSVDESWVEWALTKNEIDNILTSLELKSASKRDIGNGVGQVPDMSFFSISKSSMGYARFPNGFIFQWGEANAGSGSANIAFPFKFPTRCCGVNPTGTSARGTSDVAIVNTIAGEMNESGFGINGFIARPGGDLYPQGVAFIWSAWGY